MKRLFILTVLPMCLPLGFVPGTALAEKELVPVADCAPFDAMYNGKRQPELRPDALSFFQKMQGINVLPEEGIDLDETDPEFYLFDGLIGDSDPRAKKVIYFLLLQAGEDGFYIAIFLMNPDKAKHVWLLIIDLSDQEALSVCGAYLVSAEDTIHLWILGR